MKLIEENKAKINTQNKQNKLMEVHMSRNIFTSTLLVAILVVLVAGNMQAQSANVAANATVMSALSIAKTDIQFGNIPASRDVVLDPKNAANAYVGSTAAVGTVTITGAISTPVLATWPSSITLTGPGAKTLTLTLAVNGNAAGTQSASTALTSGTAVTTSASGNYSMWVGGNMTTGTDLGLFTGSATFAVEYQ
jgi:hypothetical protein